MSYKFPHQVVITPITYDPNFRTESEGTPFSSDANVEQDNEIRYDFNGQMIEPALIILLPSDTDIAEGYNLEYADKTYKVNRVFPVYGKHIEVII